MINMSENSTEKFESLRKFLEDMTDLSETYIENIMLQAQIIYTNGRMDGMDYMEDIYKPLV